jgi:hypothetical protein
MASSRAAEEPGASGVERKRNETVNGNSIILISLIYHGIS